MKEANWLKWAGLVTVAYLIAVGWIIGPIRAWSFATTGHLNEVGDFLAGVFSPLALIWLVAAVLTQRQELDETREQFIDNRRVVDAQMKTIASQNELLAQQHRHAEDSAKRTYRLNLFEQRYKLYEDFIAFGIKHDPYHYAGDAYLEMVELIQRASFLFGKDIEEWFGEIAQVIYENAENRRLYTTTSDEGARFTNEEIAKSISGAESWLWEQFVLAEDRTAKFYPWLHVSD